MQSILETLRIYDEDNETGEGELNVYFLINAMMEIQIMNPIRIQKMKKIMEIKLVDFKLGNAFHKWLKKESLTCIRKVVSQGIIPDNYSLIFSTFSCTLYGLSFYTIKGAPKI